MNNFSRPRRGLQVCVLFLLFVSFAAGRGWSQEDQADGISQEDFRPLALLIKGPERIKGLPFLLPNTIPSFRGTYRWYQEEGGGREVTAYYTDKEIVPSAGWEEISCEGYTLFRLPGENRERLSAVKDKAVADLLFYPGEGKWYLFLAFSGGKEDLCLFTLPFLRRLIRFLAISRKEGVVPLPAVLR